MTSIERFSVLTKKKKIFFRPMLFFISIFAIEKRFTFPKTMYFLVIKIKDTLAYLDSSSFKTKNWLFWLMQSLFTLLKTLISLYHQLKSNKFIVIGIR